MPDENEKAVSEEKDIYGRPVKYVSDEERRAAEQSLSEEEAAKYIVQDATPSSGGVYPPSAVVAPFSADVVAAHTPGEKGPEKIEGEKTE